MKEGWINDSYLIAFDEIESEAMTAAYGVAEHVPGYKVVALLSWDDFILVDAAGRYFRVPAVPLDQSLMESYEYTYELSKLAPDAHLAGKIKWYVTPIAFGGDPRDEQNTKWIPIDAHPELVRFWNKLYRDVSGRRIAEPNASANGAPPRC